jgi:hypothetical protein
MPVEIRGTATRYPSRGGTTRLVETDHQQRMGGCLGISPEARSKAMMLY